MLLIIPSLVVTRILTCDAIICRDASFFLVFFGVLCSVVSVSVGGSKSRGRGRSRSRSSSSSSSNMRMGMRKTDETRIGIDIGQRISCSLWPRWLVDRGLEQ